jgi:hypothetical protein
MSAPPTWGEAAWTARDLVFLTDRDPGDEHEERGCAKCGEQDGRTRFGAHECQRCVSPRSRVIRP